MWSLERVKSLSDITRRRMTGRGRSPRSSKAASLRSPTSTGGRAQRARRARREAAGVYRLYRYELRPLFRGGVRGLQVDTVLAGVNWRLAPPEVAYVLNDAGAEVLFVGGECR